MAKETHGTAPPLVTLAAIGHVDHGKTTLAAAMTLVLSKRGRAKAVPYDQIDTALEARGDAAGSASRVEYLSASRRYVHVDCPAHADYVRGLITNPDRPDAALLVVSAADGPMPQTREHLLLARRVGVPRVVVFLNKADMVADPNLLTLVEAEVRELLSECEYDGAATPIVKGSALQALRCGCGEEGCPKCRVVFDLVGAFDRHLPEPVHPQDRPFLMTVEEVIGLPDGVVVSGSVARGRVRPGHRIALVGGSETVPARVTSVEGDGSGASGRTKLVLDGVARPAVAPGQVVAEPGSIAPHVRFRAEVFLLGREEGGLGEPLAAGRKAAFALWGAEVGGAVALPPDRTCVLPGDHASLLVTLDAPVALEEGLRFALREGGRSVGAGAVTEIVE